MNLIPLIILGAMSFMSLGIDLARHGEKKKDTYYNTWITLLALIIWWGLTWWAFK